MLRKVGSIWSFPFFALSDNLSVQLPPAFTMSASPVRAPSGGGSNAVIGSPVRTGAGRGQAGSPNPGRGSKGISSGQSVRGDPGRGGKGSGPAVRGAPSQGRGRGNGGGGRGVGGWRGSGGGFGRGSGGGGGGGRGGGGGGEGHGPRGGGHRRGSTGPGGSRGRGHHGGQPARGGEDYAMCSPEEAAEEAADPRVQILERLAGNMAPHIPPMEMYAMLPPSLWSELIQDPEYSRWEMWDPQHPVEKDRFQRAKCAYKPVMTCVYQSGAGQRLWIGNSVAADNVSVLQRNGITAKCCIAGTEVAGGNRTHSME